MLREPEGKRDVTLIATGSEVGLAVEAAERLAKEGVAAAVVSMPCLELFRAQPEAYRKRCSATRRASPSRPPSSRAGTSGCGDKGVFVGMDDFGASAPAPKLFKHFGITPERIAEVASGLVKRS